MMEASEAQQVPAHQASQGGVVVVSEGGRGQCEIRMLGLVFLAIGCFATGAFVAAVYLGRFPPAKTAEAANTSPRSHSGTHAGISPAHSLTHLPPKILREMDIGKAQLDTAGQLVQQTEDGVRITYTLDSDLQKYAERVLLGSGALAATLVMIEVRTGKVVVMAEHRTNEFQDCQGPLYFCAHPPAASIFKIITAAALLEKNAVQPETLVCYHGGERRLGQAHLLDNPARDRSCATLRQALGQSINPVFAKLADRNLSSAQLEATAKRFGFGSQVPLQYPVSVGVSETNIPEERLEMAKTAAGFWNATLSPLHGALIAQAIASGGKMVVPSVVEKIETDSGKVLWRFEKKEWLQVAAEEVSNTIALMMIETVEHGTAREHFYDKTGKPFLPKIDVAGKTGSLAQKRPFQFYSWFIGFAPVKDPQVAVAALAVNGQVWKLKGGTMAMKLLTRLFRKEAPTTNSK